MTSTLPPIGTRHRTPNQPKAPNQPKEKNEYLTGICNSILFRKSEYDIKNNLVCLTSSSDSIKTKRFYYKMQNKPARYLGTEREFNDCIHNYNVNKEQNKQIKLDNIKKDACGKKKYEYNKNGLLDYLSTIHNTLKMHDDIYYFLKYIINKTNVDLLAFNEILKGAFVILQDDGGKFYTHFKTQGSTIEYEIILDGVAFHKSTHWSRDPQFRLGKDDLVNLTNSNNQTFDLLMGTSILPDFKGSTWFQFENSRMTSASTVVMHALDYVKYALFSRGNLGPFGESLHVELREKGPLIVNVCDNFENCLFEKNDNPINNSLTYWNKNILKIRDYAELTGMIYTSGNQIHENSLFDITGKLADNYKVARYANTNKSLSEIIPEVISKIKRSKMTNLTAKIGSGASCSLLDYENISDKKPDVLIMEVLDIIYKCISPSRGGKKKSTKTRRNAKKKRTIRIKNIISNKTR